MFRFIFFLSSFYSFVQNKHHYMILHVINHIIYIFRSSFCCCVLGVKQVISVLTFSFLFVSRVWFVTFRGLIDNYHQTRKIKLKSISLFVWERLGYHFYYSESSCDFHLTPCHPVRNPMRAHRCLSPLPLKWIPLYLPNFLFWAFIFLASLRQRLSMWAELLIDKPNVALFCKTVIKEIIN